MLDIEGALNALKSSVGIELTEHDLLITIRQSYIHALWLEKKQGYTHEEYTLPAQIFDDPNSALEKDHFITREFFNQLSTQIWDVFDKEISFFDQKNETENDHSSPALAPV